MFRIELSGLTTFLSLGTTIRRLLLQDIIVNQLEEKDEVTVNPISVIEDGLIWGGYVSGDFTVTLRLANVTGSAINPAETSFRITVRHYGN